jgi:hypothetical protein
MKTLNFELTRDLLSEFVLTNEEMIVVRGGEADPVTLPNTPPIRI